MQSDWRSHNNFPSPPDKDGGKEGEGFIIRQNRQNGERTGMRRNEIEGRLRLTGKDEGVHEEEKEGKSHSRHHKMPSLSEQRLE